MVDRFRFADNRMTITKNDKVAFDSNAKSIQLFPEETRIELTGQSIVFPTLLPANCYQRYSVTPGGPTYCESWSTLLRQEWGPSEVNFTSDDYEGNAINTRNLPLTLLGTVPPETDYLDVRVKLTRTKDPAAFWSVAAPYVLFAEGQWINLVGGSCPTEFYPPMLFRHFDIYRSGTNVYLRRFQSVRNKETTATVMPSGGTIISSDVGTSFGWTVGNNGTPTGVENANAKASWPAVLIDFKGPDSSGTKARNGTNSCAVPGRDVDYPDLEAIYSGDIVIHPGRYE